MIILKNKDNHLLPLYDVQEVSMEEALILLAGQQNEFDEFPTIRADDPFSVQRHTDQFQRMIESYFGYS